MCAPVCAARLGMAPKLNPRCSISWQPNACTERHTGHAQAVGCCTAHVNVACLPLPLCHCLPQVLQLSRLTSLIIAHSGYTPAGFNALANLASLRRLRIINCHAPARLPALTGLEHLFLDTHSGDIDLSGQLEDAFAQLRSLTSLVLRVLSHWVPVALGSLSRLQRLSFSMWHADELNYAGLPAGPWLASIRWLGLPWPVLEHSAAAVVANAPNLEFLCSNTLPETPLVNDHYWCRFWRFLTTHPPLRCFAVEMGPVGGLGQATVLPSFELMRALLQLQRTHPALCLRCVAGVDFQHELCESESIPEQDPPAF